MLLWIFCYQLKPISLHGWHKSSCFSLITKCNESEFRIWLDTLLIILHWWSLLSFLFMTIGYNKLQKYSEILSRCIFRSWIICDAYSTHNEPWKRPHNLPWIFTPIIYISHLKTWELLIPQHCGLSVCHSTEWRAFSSHSACLLQPAWLCGDPSV